MEYSDGETWKLLHEGAKIGEELLIDLPETVKAAQVRLTILEGRTVQSGDTTKVFAPGIESFELYKTGGQSVTPTPTPTPPVTPTPTPTPPVTPTPTPTPTTPPVTPNPTPDPDNPSKEVLFEIKEDDKVPNIRPQNLNELKEVLLTDKEKAMAAAGVKIAITMKVTGVDEHAPDIAILKGGLNGQILGKLLNIELFKQIGNESPQQITQMSRPVRFVLEIPGELKRSDSVKRTYTLISLHKDQVLQWADLDDDPDTITAEIDKFSVFAIAYRDETKHINQSDGNKDDSGNGSSGTDNQKILSVQTGDEAPVILFVLLAAAAVLAGAAVIVIRRKRKRSTTGTV